MAATSFRLGNLMKATRLAHEAAHDALSDARDDSAGAARARAQSPAVRLRALGLVQEGPAEWFIASAATQTAWPFLQHASACSAPSAGAWP